MAENTKKGNIHRLISFWVGLLFLSLYLLGEFFPDYWWATHSTAFIPSSFKYLTFSVAFALLIATFFPNLLWHKFAINSIKSSTISIWVLSLLMGLLFYFFPIVADFYGEAYILNPQVTQTVSKVSEQAHNDLFSFGLNPWAGQKTIFAFITYLAYYSGETILSIIRYFDAFFGFAFVLTWLLFINKQLQNFSWKVILTIAVFSAPFLLNFYGHLEINAIVLWVALFWLTLFIKYLETPRAKLLWTLFFVLIFALKIHAITLFFAPLWLYSCVNFYFTKSAKNFINWKQAFYSIIAPIYAVGIFCYFFIFKDYNDPRNLDYTVKEYDRLFLPIISPEAPLDKYNLFSFNHIFDYLNEFLLWSPIALFIFVVILFSSRKKINWKRPELVFTGTLLTLLVSFFFMLNPLLSMQMDWDLFTLPAPVFLVFVVLLIKQIEHTKLHFNLLPVVFALTVANLPFFTVHFSEIQLSKKLESLGTRIYYTYYEWSSQTIHNGLSLLAENRDYQIERKNILLYKLKEHAIEGNDREYSLLWRKEGSHFLDYHKDAGKAYVYLEKALDYNPTDNYSRLLLLETCLLLDQNEQAYELSLELKNNNYPQAQTAEVTAVQAALISKKYEKALEFSNEYLAKWVEDTTMQKINYRLQNNIDVEQLQNLFYIPKELFKK